MRECRPCPRPRPGAQREFAKAIGSAFDSARSGASCCRVQRNTFDMAFNGSISFDYLHLESCGARETCVLLELKVAEPQAMLDMLRSQETGRKTCCRPLEPSTRKQCCSRSELASCRWTPVKEKPFSLQDEPRLRYL